METCILNYLLCFGDANRYSYYAKPNKIKQVFLSKVRNQNGMTREEFDAMPARDLQKMIVIPLLHSSCLKISRIP